MHSKWNYKQNEKNTYGLGENICRQRDWQGLNLQIAHTTQRQQKPSWKMSRKTKDISPKKIHEKAHEKDVQHC